MVAPKLPDQKGRMPYKLYMSLFPSEWAKLRAEAERRHITGREVIEAALSHYCLSLPSPAPIHSDQDAPPEEEADAAP